MSSFAAPVSSRSLGMENNEILDSQITASTDYGHKSAARFARLNLKVKLGVHHGCWIREENDINPWLQVDFVKYAKIIAIEMQGRPDVNRWIKTYTVSYSRDEQNFQVYEEFGVQKVGKRSMHVGLGRNINCTIVCTKNEDKNPTEHCYPIQILTESVEISL